MLEKFKIRDKIGDTELIYRSDDGTIEVWRTSPNRYSVVMVRGDERITVKPGLRTEKKAMEEADKLQRSENFVSEETRGGRIKLIATDTGASTTSFTKGQVEHILDRR